MKNIQILFIGNCQAQYFESLAGFLNPEFRIPHIPPVWLINAQNFPDVEKHIKDADLIVCQRLSSNFHVEAMRRENLCASTKAKVIFWPNMYFDGYFPGIRYLYGQSGKIEGPLADYHFQFIIDGWREKISRSQLCEKFGTGDFSHHPQFAEKSILNLKRREKDVDVRITDFITERFRSKQLFYSMNHPTNIICFEMMRRIYSYLGLKFMQTALKDYNATLNEIIIPAFPIFKKKYAPMLSEYDKFKGVVYDFESKSIIRSRVDYDMNELIDIYYEIYDRNAKDIHNAGGSHD